MQKHLLTSLIAVFSISTASAQVLLYDQTANVGTGGILCRTHDNPAQTTFDTEGADDFDVPAGETWYIDSIVVPGTYNGFTPPNNVPTIINFYADNSGEPGTAIFTDTITDGDPDNDQDLEVFLETPVALTTGKYWVSVRVHTSDVPWYWLRIPNQVTAHPSHWKNPGGGYNLCTVWEPLYICLTSVSDLSYAFQVYGCYGPNKPLYGNNIDTSLCAGNGVTVDLMADTLGAQTNVGYTWNTGQTGMTITVDSSGIYEVYAENSVTLCGITQSFDVNIIEVTEPVLNDTTVCENDLPYIFQAPASACVNCLNVWPDSSSGIFFGAQQAGTYTLTILDTVSGCTASDDAILSVEPSDATFSPGLTIDLCEGEEIEVSISEILNNYTWQLYDGLNWITISNNSFANITYGQAIAVSGTSLLGCFITDTAFITERPSPDPSVTSEAETSTGNMTLTASGGYQAYDWSTGGSNQSITVSQNGLYTVTVTDEYGCEGSKTYNVFNVGIEDVIASLVQVFPNPSKGQLNILWPQQWVNEAMANVFDLTGRRIASFTATATQQLIDLGNLEAGQYVIQYQTPEGNGQHVLVISK